MKYSNANIKLFLIIQIFLSIFTAPPSPALGAGEHKEVGIAPCPPVPPRGDNGGNGKPKGGKGGH